MPVNIENDREEGDMSLKAFDAGESLKLADAILFGAESAVSTSFVISKPRLERKDTAPEGPEKFRSSAAAKIITLDRSMIAFSTE